MYRVNLRIVGVLNHPHLPQPHLRPIFLRPTLDKKEALASSQTAAQLIGEGSRLSNKYGHYAGAAPIIATTTAATSTTSKTLSLWVRFKNEMVHYWHGTKLLGTEIKISTKLANSIFHGKKLTRREQQQLRRTTKDLLRLIPFSVFVIVPFMEFLLPFALRLFPNMLPSTFEHASEADEKKRKLIKMRFEVAKFMQQTIEGAGSVPVSKTATTPPAAAATAEGGGVSDFSTIIQKIRSTTGEQTSTEELIRVVKSFPDEVTLDNLTRLQLLSMCRYMNLNAFGTDAFLRYQLRAQMSSIKKDDQLIISEGIDSLTMQELSAACQTRGMCTMHLTPEQMKRELAQWLDLHLTYSIPTTLLILSHSLSFYSSNEKMMRTMSASSSESNSRLDLSNSTSEASTTTTNLSRANANKNGNNNDTPIEPVAEALRATLSSLPEDLVNQAQLHVSELEGAPVNVKQKLAVLKQQEAMIAKEKAQEESLKLALQQDDFTQLQLAAAAAGIAQDRKSSLPESHKAKTMVDTLDTPTVATMSSSIHSPAPSTSSSPVQVGQLEAVTSTSDTSLATEDNISSVIPKEPQHRRQTTPSPTKSRLEIAVRSSSSELMTDAQAVEAMRSNAVMPHNLSPIFTQKDLNNNNNEPDNDNDGLRTALAKEYQARLTEEQLLELREALAVLASRSAILEERERFEELKKDRARYLENLFDLAQVHRQEHASTRRLGVRLEKMIERLDQELLVLQYDANNNSNNNSNVVFTNERGELTTRDIAGALKVIKHAPKEENIKEIVKRLDVDGDGLVLLSHIWELADRVENEEGI
ncbi:hypothetical protein BG004_006678, partial [Podila humilis]